MTTWASAMANKLLLSLEARALAILSAVSHSKREAFDCCEWRCIAFGVVINKLCCSSDDFVGAIYNAGLVMYFRGVSAVCCHRWTSVEKKI